MVNIKKHLETEAKIYRKEAKVALDQIANETSHAEQVKILWTYHELKSKAEALESLIKSYWRDQQ